MKKTKLVGAAAIFALLLLAAYFWHIHSNPLTQIGKLLGISIQQGSITTNLDNHGGFHGDGITYMEIHFSENHCLSEIRENSEWKRLPLTANLERLVTTVTSFAKDEATRQSIDTSSLYTTAHTPIPLTITNGYYCFIDRFPEADNANDDFALWNRYAQNCTLAIYDADTHILYYLALDT